MLKLYNWIQNQFQCISCLSFINNILFLLIQKKKKCITSKCPPKNHFPFCFKGHYRHYDFIMHYQQTLYHFNSLKVESLFLLLWLVPILLHKYHTTNSQTLIFSQVSKDSTLSFLYNIREIVTNKHSHNSQRHKDSHKAKKPKKINTSIQAQIH